MFVVWLIVLLLLDYVVEIRPLCYYGSKTEKGYDPAILWKDYFTSSKYVKRFRKGNGEPDVIGIRRMFDDAKTCLKWETGVLCRMNDPAT